MSETTLKDLIKNDNVVLENLREFDFVFSLSVDDDVTLYIARYAKPGVHKDGLTQIFPLSLILLGISTAGAFIFARLMSRPIRRLANETVKMTKLESVDTPAPRSDEIGLLADNVHTMYAQLKSTIAKLENEIQIGKELEEKQRYFFGAASHELKTPVAAVTTILEGFIGKVIQPEEYPEYFQKCLQMMKLQGKLVAEILNIVRLEEGVVSLEREPVNLTPLVKSVLPSCQALAEIKNQNILVNLPEDLFSCGDKYILSLALSNVLMNAVQNSPEGAEIRVWSEPAAVESGETRGRLFVLNTNAHIDEAVISRIFEPFYRIDKSRNSSQGSGSLLKKSGFGKKPRRVSVIYDGNKVKSVIFGGVYVENDTILAICG